jgi:hypothetical protein
LLDSQLQDETEDIQHNQGQSSRGAITPRNKNKLKRKREAEEDAILKKASAILNKAINSNNLKVFAEFFLVSFEDCVMNPSERRQKEIINAYYWMLE